MLRTALKSLAVVALALVLSAPVTAQPRPEKRVALVIGIADYTSARRLANPLNDARAVEKALAGLGFKVTVETNRNRRRLLTALDDFAEENRGADIVLVYFAGHGVQVGGRNVLLPTDARLDSAAALEASALPLEQLFERAAAVAPRRIILLDACRNDPFGAGAGTGRGVTAADPGSEVRPGLGRIGRADGAIYAFATAPGMTAADGDGDNSPFAQALAAHLAKPGLEFGSVMKLVQMEVYERTRGVQLPYVEDALPDLVFADLKGEPLPERDRLLLAMARIDAPTRGQVERIATMTDVPLAPLYGALLAAEAELGRGDHDAREKRLTRAAEDFAKVRGNLKTLASADPKVATLRGEAERRLSLGAFEGATAVLTEAIALDRASGSELETRLKERNLSEALSLAARAGIARTKLGYRAAATDFAAAAALAERWDARTAWSYRVDQADSLFSQGSEFGDNGALVEAIAAYRAAAGLVSREVSLKDWALTHNNLGNALSSLGDREATTERLSQAVAAYQAALTAYRRDREPLDWARTQSNLATALQNLGQRDGSPERLEQAVVAYRAALTEYTRERKPQEWALIQVNLGSVLSDLGERDSGNARFEQAAAALRAALMEATRERAPLVWATANDNLGTALRRWGEREAGTERLVQAVAAYREALKERTRERVPLQWALTFNNLGSALRAVGERQNSKDILEAAVMAYREALRERTRERVPLDWATTQNNLANALAVLSDREPGGDRLAEAVAAFREVLKVYTRDRMPLDWARTQNNLAGALARLGLREGGTMRLEEAVAAYRAALQERTRERGELAWAMTQSNLAVALRHWGERESGTRRLEESIATYRAAIPVFERAGAARYAEVARNGLALAEGMLAKRKRGGR